jgi:hypothetical protein
MLLSSRSVPPTLAPVSDRKRNSPINLPAAGESGEIVIDLTDAALNNEGNAGEGTDCVGAGGWDRVSRRAT